MGYNLPTYSLSQSTADVMATSRLVAEDAAAIMAGGPNEATEYARAWYARHPTNAWAAAVEHSPAKAAEMIARASADVRASARAIVDDGRPHYLSPGTGGRSMLVVASLVADGSAGPTGYLPFRLLPGETG